MPPPRVLWIGLDGATFDVLDPLFARGCMPNLAGVVARGVRGVLRSTDPYVTAPAWTSLVTGKRPDTTGVFDWSVPRPDRYPRRLLNSTFREAQAFWELLAARGIPAGTLNLPLTYPPSPEASFCVADMFTPAGVTEFTEPASLRLELESLGYQIDVRRRDFIPLGSAAFDAYLDALIRLTRARGRGLRLCLERFPWRMAIGVFTEPDRLQHPFWHHLEFRSEHWSPATTRAAEFFSILDAEIGQIVEQVGPDTHVYFMSDHGFGPHSGAFYVNSWLEDRGYLVRRQESPLLRRGRTLARGGLRRLGERTRRLAEQTGQELPRLDRSLERLREVLGEGLTPGASAVAWSHTLAFADSPHGIRLNVRGREPEGIVAPEDVPALLERLTGELLAVRDPRTGLPLHARVEPREARYSGRLTALAPDLVYTFADAAYSWRIAPIQALELGRRLPGTFLAVETEWETGTHRPEGFLIGAGPELAAGVQLEPTCLWDLLPTALYHLNQQIPPDLEGRVLSEAFQPEVIARRPARWGGPPAVRHAGGPQSPGHFAQPSSDQDEAAVAEHLRALGYLA